MKLIAYLLLSCLFLMSSLEVIGSGLHTKGMEDCCKGVSCKHSKTQQNKNGCESRSCSKTVACCRVSLVVAQELVLLGQYAIHNDKNFSSASSGIISGYPKIGWHPPKV